MKKLLLPPIFKAEPSQATPGGEICGNSVWGDQVLGLNSSTGDVPAPSVLPSSTLRFVSAGGSLVLVVRYDAASPRLGSQSWPCPAGVTM